MQFTSPWIVQKLGLQDFWYYDEEEFSFIDGRMLLRGSNGSGKSVTMQSFIPLLLDGNKSAQRLDAFGSKERKMFNYLLEEGDEREERTGYLYMEFKRKDSDTYLTIGMGNRARKNGTLTSWYFYITDGRRVHIDIDLYRSRSHRIALSQKELTNRIKEGGAVLTSQKEYMAKVNDMLFGFDTIENYQELLTLLIQLRQPKLSKDFKPTKLNEILTTSLTPLSEDDLRPMSEAVENMDAIQTTLATLKNSRKACERIDTVYRAYNEKILYDKTISYLSSYEKKESFLKEEKEAEKRLKEKREELSQQKALYQSLETELQTRKEEERNLRKNKAFQLKEQLEDYRMELRKQEDQKALNLSRLHAKQDKQMTLQNDVKEKTDLIDSTAYDIRQLLKDMDAQSEEIFISHEQLCMPLKKDAKAEVELSSLMKLAQAQQKRIQNTVALLREKESNQHLLLEQEEALEQAKLHRDDKERELEKLKRLLLETKQELIEKINIWEEQNQLLFLGDQRQEVFTKLEMFDLEHSYFEITDIVMKQKQEIERKLREQTIPLQLQLQQLQSQIKDTETELQTWIAKEDPEPQRDAAVIRNRELLRAAGIPFHPFYKVIEFHPQMDAIHKNRLEEALEDMGLLDALIIDERYREQVMQLDEGKDRYVFASKEKIVHPLQFRLEPDVQCNDIFLSKQIQQILDSISKDQDASTYIDSNGNYGIGILKGKISGTIPSRFIGYRSRQRYRQERIDTLRDEIQQLKEQESTIQSQLLTFKDKLQLLDEEYHTFPQGKDLQEALRMVQKCEHELLAVKEQINSRMDAVIQYQHKINDLHNQVTELQKICGFQGGIEAYRQAEQDMCDYIANITELQRETMRIRSTQEQLQTLFNQVEDIKADLDERLARISVLEQLLQGLQQKIDSIEEQLQVSDYEHLQDKIDRCLQRLEIIPVEKEKLNGDSRVLEKDILELDKKIEGFKASFEQIETAFKNREIVLQEELQLGFYTFETASKQLYLQAKELKDKLFDEKERTLQDVFQQLSTRFHENKESLLDYNLIQEEAEVHDSSNRILLTARVSGVKIPFYALYEQIKSDISIQELLLSNKERELFEDILANTLGKKIRYKIQKSKEWVTLMNQSMSQMDISSNLKLSLEWKNKQAEEEGQLGTKQLVELLNMDSEIMTEAQMKKLAQHFRSKLVQARKRLEEKENTQTLHRIMKDIFDYRTWFEFQLYYEKGLEKRKELTNSRFLVFSGGEKAISMYVPLFSAAVAKYNGARSDAPRIICLDEAFAGVDDRNIANMFQMMTDCNFQFILNSQSLWGDYESNPGMAIYQLETDNQAKFVTTMAYQWNGMKTIPLDIQEA